MKKDKFGCRDSNPVSQEMKADVKLYGSREKISINVIGSTGEATDQDTFAPDCSHIHP